MLRGYRCILCVLCLGSPCARADDAPTACPLDVLHMQSIAFDDPFQMDFSAGGDGTLFAEIVLLENILQHGGSHDGDAGDGDFFASCLIMYEPLAGCLDVAGPSTLRGVGSTVEVLPVGADSSAAAGYCNLTQAPGSQPSDLIDGGLAVAPIGDGRLDSLDFALLYWIFDRQRSGSITSVADRTGVAIDIREHARACLAYLSAMGNSDDADVLQDISRATDVANATDAELAALAMANHSCDAATPGWREANAGTLVENVTLDYHLAGRGSWYHVHMRHAAQFAAIELRLVGLANDTTGELSNMPPPTAAVDAGDGIVVRFARTSPNDNSAACAPLRANMGMADLIVGPRLALRHEYPLQSCPFDLHIWVPLALRADVSGCVFGVDAGNRAMNLRHVGAVQAHRACAPSADDGDDAVATSAPADAGASCSNLYEHCSHELCADASQSLYELIALDHVSCCDGYVCDTAACTCRLNVTAPPPASSSLAVDALSATDPPPAPSPQPPPSPLPPWPSMPTEAANGNVALAIITAILVGAFLVVVAVALVMIARWLSRPTKPAKPTGVNKPLMQEARRPRSATPPPAQNELAFCSRSLHGTAVAARR